MKGKNMKNLREMGSVDSEKLEKENLEGGEKESGYTLEKLAEKMLEEAGPYINGLIEKTRNEVRKEILKDDYLSENEKEKLLSDEKGLDENASMELRKTVNFFYEGISLKEITQNCLIAEAIAILDIKRGNYRRAVIDCNIAGISDKMQKILDNLKPKEREFAEKEMDKGKIDNSFLVKILEQKKYRERKQIYYTKTKN